MTERSKWLVFTILSMLFGMNQYLEFKGIYIEFLFSYFDDLVALPICMFIAERAATLLFKDFILKPWMLVTTVLYFTLAFEWYFSIRYPTKFTSDWLDAVCYALGALSYWYFLRKMKIVG